MNSSGGTRDGSDPIAELLSQLSGVRRAQSNSVPGSSASSSQGGHNVSSQLQQLQMQLQLERQQVRVLFNNNRIKFFQLYYDYLYLKFLIAVVL